ncbi:MAG: TOBE domain-containing protein, partial [Myxococcota bacterium]
VAEFVGSPRINVLPARLAAGSPEAARYVGVRPRHLSLVETDGDLQGPVLLVERLGDESLLHVDVEGADAPVVVSTIVAPPDTGATVHLALPEDRLLFFGEDGTTLEREAT